MKSRMTKRTNEFPTMAEYIKLNIFVSRIDSGFEEDKVIPSWVKHNSIVIIQEVNDAAGFKSYITVDGLDEGIKVVETASEIIKAPRFGC